MFRTMCDDCLDNHLAQLGQFGVMECFLPLLLAPDLSDYMNYEIVCVFPKMVGLC